MFLSAQAEKHANPRSAKKMTSGEKTSGQLRVHCNEGFVAGWADEEAQGGVSAGDVHTSVQKLNAVVTSHDSKSKKTTSQTITNKQTNNRLR